MGVTRRIIFPTIRILLWAVIAAALVKMAFTGAEVTLADDSLRPHAEIVEPHVEVGSGTITNTVSVTASVVADAATPARATLAGTVSKLLATDGQHVDAGTPILVIRLETPVEPTVTTNAETGEQTVTENKPTVKKVTVTAPIAGTLALPTLVEQIVSVGDTVASVTPGTLSVSGTLTADQQYRLIGAPTEAEVTLKGGPAPFTCTGLRIGALATTDAQPAGTDAGTDAGAASTSGQVTCAIPAGVTAFAGLGADISITNGSAVDAVVVPVTSVQGSVQQGNVWVVLPDGAAEERAVSLGLTDGEIVQVVEGLAVGETILEYIPVATEPIDCTSPDADPMACGG